MIGTEPPVITMSDMKNDRIGRSFTCECEVITAYKRSKSFFTASWRRLNDISLAVTGMEYGAAKKGYFG